MKKIILLPLSLLMLFFASCEDQVPMEDLMYPESVYIVGAGGLIVNRNVDMGDLQDTVYASIAVSSSLPIPADAVVELQEFPSAIAAYNNRELSPTDVQFQNLASDVYSFPSPNATVKAGETYGTYPIYVKPATLHIDSLYMISLKLKSTSEYDLSKEDTLILMRFNLMNQYSGLYYMNGAIKEAANLNDSVVYSIARNLQAVVDGNTVRMYHEKNEWTRGSTDYRPDYCFNIKVNPDKSLTLSTWENFNIVTGGGRYYPEVEAYDLYYTFIEGGVTKKVKGILYKERKNDEEQRLINDWMEENRTYDWNW